VEQRHRDKAHALRAEAERFVRDVDERILTAPRQHRSLGETRRARRVELQRDVVGRHFDARIVSRSGIPPCRVVFVCRVRAKHEDARHAGEVTLDLVEHRHELLADDRNARPRVVDDVDDLRGRQSPVDGTQHRADLRSAEHDLEHLERVLVEHRDPVARTDPIGDEGIGDFARGRVELAVGEVSPFERERDAVTDGVRLVADQLSQRVSHGWQFPSCASAGAV